MTKPVSPSVAKESGHGPDPAQRIGSASSTRIASAWVTARSTAGLVGFVNVTWDGRVHARIQEEMAASSARRGGIGREVMLVAAQSSRRQLRTSSATWVIRNMFIATLPGPP